MTATQRLRLLFERASWDACDAVVMAMGAYPRLCNQVSPQPLRSPLYPKFFEATEPQPQREPSFGRSVERAAEAEAEAEKTTSAPPPPQQRHCPRAGQRCAHRSGAGSPSKKEEADSLLSARSSSRWPCNAFWAPLRRSKSASRSSPAIRAPPARGDGTASRAGAEAAAGGAGLERQRQQQRQQQQQQQ